jgi:hypothetical protein
LPRQDQEPNPTHHEGKLTNAHMHNTIIRCLGEDRLKDEAGNDKLKFHFASAPSPSALPLCLLAWWCLSPCLVENVKVEERRHICLLQVSSLCLYPSCLGLAWLILACMSCLISGWCLVLPCLALCYGEWNQSNPQSRW